MRSEDKKQCNVIDEVLLREERMKQSRKLIEIMQHDKARLQECAELQYAHASKELLKCAKDAEVQADELLAEIDAACSCSQAAFDALLPAEENT